MLDSFKLWTGPLPFNCLTVAPKYFKHTVRHVTCHPACAEDVVEISPSVLKWQVLHNDKNNMSFTTFFKNLFRNEPTIGRWVLQNLSIQQMKINKWDWEKSLWWKERHSCVKRTRQREHYCNRRRWLWHLRDLCLLVLTPWYTPSSLLGCTWVKTTRFFGEVLSRVISRATKQDFFQTYRNALEIASRIFGLICIFHDMCNIVHAIWNVQLCSQVVFPSVWRGDDAKHKSTRGHYSVRAWSMQVWVKSPSSNCIFFSQFKFIKLKNSTQALR